MVEITKYCFNCSWEKSRICKFRPVIQDNTAKINACKDWDKLL